MQLNFQNYKFQPETDLYIGLYVNISYTQPIFIYIFDYNATQLCYTYASRSLISCFSVKRESERKWCATISCFSGSLDQIVVTTTYFLVFDFGSCCVWCSFIVHTTVIYFCRVHFVEWMIKLDSMFSVEMLKH